MRNLIILSIFLSFSPLSFAENNATKDMLTSIDKFKSDISLFLGVDYPRLKEVCLPKLSSFSYENVEEAKNKLQQFNDCLGQDPSWTESCTDTIKTCANLENYVVKPAVVPPAVVPPAVVPPAVVPPAVVPPAVVPPVMPKYGQQLKAPKAWKLLKIAKFIYIPPYSGYDEMLNQLEKKKGYKYRTLQNYLIDIQTELEKRELDFNLQLKEGFGIQQYEVSINDFMNYINSSTASEESKSYSDILDMKKCPLAKWSKKSENIDFPAICLQTQDIENYIKWLKEKANGKADGLSLPSPKQWLIASIFYGESTPIVMKNNPNKDINIDKPQSVFSQIQSEPEHLIGNIRELSKNKKGYFSIGESIYTEEFSSEYEQYYHLRLFKEKEGTIGFRLICKSDGEKCL